MFLYAYADIMNFVLQPGSLEEVQGGEIGGMAITGTMLLGAAAWMTCAALMIAASVVLSPQASRRVNIAYGALSTIVIPVLALTSEPWGYYYLFNFVEVILTGYVVWVALSWPRESMLGVEYAATELTPVRESPLSATMEPVTQTTSHTSANPVGRPTRTNR